jgi:hypothetical protein
MKVCLFLCHSMSPFSRKKVYGGERILLHNGGEPYALKGASTVRRGGHAKTCKGCAVPTLQFVERQYWLRSCASPRCFRANLVKGGRMQLRHTRIHIHQLQPTTKSPSQGSEITPAVSGDLKLLSNEQVENVTFHRI